MTTYQQVHDLTSHGLLRFDRFISQHGREGLSVAACRAACLGAVEDNLNSDSSPLTWELPASDSADNQPHTFIADLDELIIETVHPNDSEAG